MFYVLIQIPDFVNLHAKVAKIFVKIAKSMTLRINSLRFFAIRLRILREILYVCLLGNINT